MISAGIQSLDDGDIAAVEEQYNRLAEGFMAAESAKAQALYTEGTVRFLATILAAMDPGSRLLVMVRIACLTDELADLPKAPTTKQ